MEVRKTYSQFHFSLKLIVQFFYLVGPLDIIFKEDWISSCKEDKEALISLILKTHPHSINYHRLALITGTWEFATVKQIVLSSYSLKLKPLLNEMMMKTMTEELIIPATILEDGMEIPGTGESASVPF